LIVYLSKSAKKTLRSYPFSIWILDGKLSTECSSGIKKGVTNPFKML